MDATESIQESGLNKTTNDLFTQTFNQTFEEQTKKLKDLFEPHIHQSGNSSNASSIEETKKETNNNHLMMNSVDIVNYVDNNFWTSADNNILEDFSCWVDGSVNQEATKTENTDGAIYTLTVLNGAEHVDNSNWFKQEDKDDALPQSSSLDLDSLLNISPFSNGYTTTNIKQEYVYDDSGFAEHKEDSLGGHSSGLSNSPGFTNNEWKQNTGEVNSLLRSALQGKGFVRYNGIKIEKDEEKTEEHTIVKLESPFLVTDTENGTSSHGVDDLFLPQFDVTYPEDYEKLKRIESEVAESAEQYLDPNIPFNVPIPVANHTAVVEQVNNKSNQKKYTKRKSTTNSSTSSSGIRKERSLHYCTICSKGFKDKYSVNVHIRTHTGEKPFACSLCGKSFRQKAHLAKHYQTHMAQAKTGVSQKGNKNSAIAQTS